VTEFPLGQLSAAETPPIRARVVTARETGVPRGLPWVERRRGDARTERHDRRDRERGQDGRRDVPERRLDPRRDAVEPSEQVKKETRIA
jgi:hypothetical protein